MKNKKGQRLNPEFEAEMSRVRQQMETLQNMIQSAETVVPLLRDVLTRLDSYSQRDLELEDQIKNTTSETERLMLMNQAIKENEENQLKVLQEVIVSQQAAQTLYGQYKQLQALQDPNTTPLPQLTGDNGAVNPACPITTLVTPNFRMPRMLTVHVLHVQLPAPVPTPYEAHMILMAKSQTSWFDVRYNSSSCNEPVFAVRIRFNNSIFKLDGHSNRQTSGQVDPLVVEKFPLFVGKEFSLHIVEEKDKFCVKVDGNMVAQFGKAGYAHLNKDYTTTSDPPQVKSSDETQDQASGSSETNNALSSESQLPGSSKAQAIDNSIATALESLQGFTAGLAQVAANDPKDSNPTPTQVREILGTEEVQASETPEIQALDSKKVSGPEAMSDSATMGMKGERVELLSWKVLRNMLDA